MADLSETGLGAAARPSAPPITARQMFHGTAEELRVLIVGGIPFGVVVAGLGSRLAMFLLRVTSPGNVIGVTSDDGFVIGRFTLGGTYNLMMLGALVGLIGAAAYRLVARRLIGPMWFQRVTVGLASGAVVGSMLVHADGIDFRLLKPTWFAIGLFVALPAIFGALIGPSVDWAARANSWPAQGRRRWAVPAVLLVAFLLIVFPLSFFVPVVFAWVGVRDLELVERVRNSRPIGLAVQAGWFSIAVVGLLALINDITDIV